MKIDIGGGFNPKSGFVNVDKLPTADIVIDLDFDSLPFENDSVDEAYSSHTFEHIQYPVMVLKELMRVCKLGAKFELRVPHWLSDMSMCGGHLHTISPTQIRHWTKDFIKLIWGDSEKRLSEPTSIEYIPSSEFPELKDLYMLWRFDQIMRFAPGACHEIRYTFNVISNE